MHRMIDTFKSGLSIDSFFFMYRQKQETFLTFLIDVCIKVYDEISVVILECYKLVFD